MKYRIIFENCGHEAFFRRPIPEAGEIAYCLKCQRYQVVLANQVHSFHAQCRECKWEVHVTRHGELALLVHKHKNKSGHDIRSYQTHVTGDLQ